jgi:hypothetical protein
MFPRALKISVFVRIVAFGSALALSACGRAGHPLPTPRETPIVTTAIPTAEDEPTESSMSTSTSTSSDDGVEIPKTPEEIRHQKAETIVAEKDLPAEMSRDDMLRLIDETEKELPFEPVTAAPTNTASTTESTTTETASEQKKETPSSDTTIADTKPTGGGLLTVEPKQEKSKVDAEKVVTAPKEELPKLVLPEIPRAKADATAVKKPVIPVLKPDPTKTSTSTWIWPSIPPKKTEPTTPKTTPSPIPPVKTVPETKKPEEKKTTTTPPKKGEPKKEPKAEPKPPVEKKVEPDVDSNITNDNGIDEDDQKFEEEYAGPKTVIVHPMSTADYQLSEIAAQLAQMKAKDYTQLQKKLVGNPADACNFFFDVALITAKTIGLRGEPVTSKNFPGKAATLDTAFFAPGGWKRITVAEMKQWFREGRTFDVAIQRDPPKGKIHGHIAIPVGLNADGNVMVAEASIKSGKKPGVSNRLAVYSDASLDSKFKIFARYAK